MMYSLPWIFRFEPVEQHLAVTADNRQQIVKVMRDAPGQAPDGFHLLRLAKLLLELLAFCDVIDLNKPGVSRPERQGMRRNLHVDECSVFLSVPAVAASWMTDPSLPASSRESLTSSGGRRSEIFILRNSSRE